MGTKKKFNFTIALKSFPQMKDKRPFCPTCGSPELHPNNQMVLIRAFKVDNKSQCLVCAGYYDDNLRYNQNSGTQQKGWF